LDTTILGSQAPEASQHPLQQTQDQSQFPIHHLLLLEDQQGQRAITLGAKTFTMGRDKRNTIVLASDTISRQHAILLRVPHPQSVSHQFRIIDGNLQGKHSTNGIRVNGQRCFSRNLVHGDMLTFGHDVTAQYFATTNPSDVEFLNTCKTEEISEFFSNLCHPFETMSVQPPEDESSLVRLASFPELITNPIIEVNSAGCVTYLNPSAMKQFPDLQEQQIQHPILVGLIDQVYTHHSRCFEREVEHSGLIFNQSIHYLETNDLIRLYLTDVTKQKQAQAALNNSERRLRETLQKAHDQLEAQIKERTSDLEQANKNLLHEIKEGARTKEELLSNSAMNRALLSAIPDWIFHINIDGTFVNYQTGSQFEVPLSTDNFLGRSIYEVLPLEIAQPLARHMNKVIFNQDDQIFEYQLWRSTGPADFEARITASREDEVIVIVRDITQRKQADQDIRSALAKERELNELKSRFVAMTSHEFRTPLATIFSSSELIEHYRHKWPTEKTEKHLQQIQAAVKHMIGLLDEVLLLGKADAGQLKFQPTPIELIHFCEELIESIQITTQNHPIIFTKSGHFENACMDEKLLRHILGNLLGNAIKYSPAGGEVIFDLKQMGDVVLFTIKDHGLGIPEADQANIFNSFNRASNVGTISGTGLGLAIVSKSVKLHGGDIDLESQEAAGTTFTVKIPMYS
jgi:signal transduction histidine kinase/pSer/pThr/pTyr-binding forkhead associated (FHA) protein